MKKGLYIATVVVVMFVTLIGCSLLPANSTNKAATQNEATISNDQDKTNETHQKDMIKLTLYFANVDNSAVPKESREVEVEDGQTIKAAIEALLEGPKSKELRKTIPEGTKLLNHEVRDDLVILDFSKEYTMANDIAEIVERVSIVNTVTELDGIKRVKIFVEGKDLIGPSGEPFGELSRVALDEQGRPIPGEVKKLTLYFANSNADALVAEQRDIIVNTGESVEKAVLEELIKGPDGKDLLSTIPEGAKLLSVETKDGTCTVNLSREIVENHPGGSTGEIMTLDSLVNSLTELESIKKVQILIEGTKREAFIHLEIDQPLERDESMIQK